MLSTGMKNKLRCPVCKSPLEIGNEQARCIREGSVYPVVNGVPVLIDERKSVFSFKDFERINQSPNSRGLRWLTHKVLPTLDLNVAGETNARIFSELLFKSSPRPIILNIGGKHPGSATSTLCASPTVECFESDVSFKNRTNLIAEPHNIPLEDSSVDAVLIDSVLEHVTDPYAVTGEIHRVLKDDGLVYADTPFMLQVHAGAIDFMRFSDLAHRRLFRQFEEIHRGVSYGPAVALSSAIQYFMLSFVNSQAARFAVKGLCRVTLFWLKYFDYYLAGKPGARDGSYAFFFMGKKSKRTLSDTELMSAYRGITPNLYQIGNLSPRNKRLTASICTKIPIDSSQLRAAKTP